MSEPFSRVYSTHQYELDLYGAVTLETVMKYLQEVSLHHHNEMLQGGFSESIWVIVDWVLDFITWPMGEQSLVISTWPISCRKFIAYRGYEIHDEKGYLLATGYSKWAVIDSKDRMPLHIPAWVVETFETYKKDGAQSPKRSGYQKQMTCLWDIERTHRIHYSDMDTNQHVNNLSYLRWSLDTLPINFYRDHVPRHLYAKYAHEVLKGDVLVRTGQKDRTSFHEVRSDGQLNAGFQIEWASHLR